MATRPLAAFPRRQVLLPAHLLKWQQRNMCGIGKPAKEDTPIKDKFDDPIAALVSLHCQLWCFCILEDEFGLPMMEHVWLQSGVAGSPHRPRVHRSPSPDAQWAKRERRLFTRLWARMGATTAGSWPPGWS